jgi:hypothetical protein
MNHGCQMVYFQTQNPKFGKFCVALVHFSGFVITYQEKSGNPAMNNYSMKTTAPSLASKQKLVKSTFTKVAFSPSLRFSPNKNIF